MASISVTYTFANATSAQAPEVNQNFTDIINGTSDGTKDFNISALTCAGAVALNGNVTLGNGSGDDITLSGSLAGSIAIKTDGSYDIGSSSLGLQAVYFGDAGGNTVNIQAPSLSSNFTFTLPGFSMTMPTSDGGNADMLCTDSSGGMKYIKQGIGFYNLSVASGTTTNSGDSVEITGADGTALSATNIGYVVMQSNTPGRVSVFEVTADVVMDLTGATFGFGADLTDQIFHVYALNNDGTLQWGVTPDSKARNLVGTADDESTIADCTSFTDVFVNSALTADAQALHFATIKADYDFTGGAAEKLFSVQSGDQDLEIEPAKTLKLDICSKTESVSGATTIAYDTEVVFGTMGSAYTTTLPTAIGRLGKRIRLVKVSSDFDAWTIDGNGSETIGGSANRKIYVQNEWLDLVSDNANWQILGRTAAKDLLSIAQMSAYGGGNIAQSSETYLYFSTVVQDDDSRITQGSANSTSSKGASYYDAPIPGDYRCASKMGGSDGDFDSNEIITLRLMKGTTEIDRCAKRAFATVGNPEDIWHVERVITGVAVSDALQVRAQVNVGAGTIWGFRSDAQTTFFEIDYIARNNGE